MSVDDLSPDSELAFGMAIDAPPLKNGDQLTIYRDGQVEVEVALPSREQLTVLLARDGEHVWCPLRGKMLGEQECTTACAAPEQRPVCWPGERIDDATQTD